MTKLDKFNAEQMKRYWHSKKCYTCAHHVIDYKEKTMGCDVDKVIMGWMYNCDKGCHNGMYREVVK